MPKNTSISLGEPYLEFIDRQIARGRFATASEAVRAGLRLLEEQEAAMDRFREEIDEDDASQEVPGFDFDDLIKRMHKKRP